MSIWAAEYDIQDDFTSTNVIYQCIREFKYPTLLLFKLILILCIQYIISWKNIPMQKIRRCMKSDRTGASGAIAKSICDEGNTNLLFRTKDPNSDVSFRI